MNLSPLPDAPSPDVEIRNALVDDAERMIPRVQALLRADPLRALRLLQVYAESAARVLGEVGAPSPSGGGEFGLGQNPFNNLGGLAHHLPVPLAQAIDGIGDAVKAQRVQALLRAQELSREVGDARAEDWSRGELDALLGPECPTLDAASTVLSREPAVGYTPP